MLLVLEAEGSRPGVGGSAGVAEQASCSLAVCERGTAQRGKGSAGGRARLCWTRWVLLLQGCESARRALFKRGTGAGGAGAAATLCTLSAIGRPPRLFACLARTRCLRPPWLSSCCSFGFGASSGHCAPGDLLPPAPSLAPELHAPTVRLHPAPGKEVLVDGCRASGPLTSRLRQPTLLPPVAAAACCRHPLPPPAAAASSCGCCVPTCMLC